jgi:hypothetical protein
MAPYPIIADIASESTTIASEIAASPELRLDPDQRPVATWTLDDGTACLAYDGLAEHLAALDPIGPVICTGHLASVQTDPEDGPIPPGQHPPRRRVPPRPVRRFGPPPPPPEWDDCLRGHAGQRELIDCHCAGALWRHSRSGRNSDGRHVCA